MTKKYLKKMLFVPSSLGNANQNSVSISSYPSQNDNDQQNNQGRRERMLSRVERNVLFNMYTFHISYIYMSGA